MNTCKRIDIIKENIEKALNRSKYNQKVKIVAVSKTFSTDKIKEVYSCGLFDFGENYVQELLKKQNELNNLKINWHFIGHLQTNKAKYLINKIKLLHSLDSLKLADVLNKRLERDNCYMDCLIQVNIGKEETKSGIIPEEVDFFIDKVIQFSRLKIKGFMCIPPFSIYTEETRKYFKKMRKIFEKFIDIKSDNINITELSMGMSKDYTVAIEEGATIVRIGTLIFGERGR